jgi:lipopolysaccharide export system permease protein
MNRLERYIAVQLMRASAMTLAVLLGLLLFLTFVDELDHVGQGSYRALDAFLVSLYAAPRLSFEAFPVAALLGSLLGLGGLAAGGELIAMRSAGMSLFGMVLAVVKAGLLMMLVVLGLGELLAPAAESAAVQIKAHKQHQQVVLKTRHGFWARDGESFVNIRRILPGAALEDITLYAFDGDRRLVRATHAARAEYRDGSWRLMDVQETVIDGDQASSAPAGEREWGAVLDPGLLTLVVAKPLMLPLWDLQRYIGFMEANGQSATTYRVAFWNKLSTPLATLVMMVLAVPFVLGGLRSSGRGQRVFVGAILGSGYFLLSRALSYGAVAYDLNPMITAMVPAGLFLAAALYALRRID